MAEWSPQGQQNRAFRFNNVRIIKDEFLGVGSYGAVYKAKCDHLPCAAKILHPVLSQTNNPGARSILERFEQECGFLSSIRHPNIVQYLGVFRDRDSRGPVLLMELLDSNLTKFLEASNRPLPYHVQVDLCFDIAQAIAYLHSNDIIHRSLSGRSVLIVAGSRAKVTNFGTSKLVDASSRMTRHTLTPCPGREVYMPPEALTDPAAYTVKLDCFSFGVLIIQTLTRLYPKPGPRTRKVPAPASPTGQIDVAVLDVERRKEQMDMISPTHPLLPVATECLKYVQEDRPSAQQLCEQLATLKEAPRYSESKQRVQESSSPAGNDTTDKDRTIQELEHELQKNAYLIQEMDMEIQGNDRVIADKDRMFRDLFRQFQDNTQVVAEFQQTLAMREQENRDLQEWISARDSHINNLQRQLQQLRIEPPPANVGSKMEEKRSNTLRGRELKEDIAKAKDITDSEVTLQLVKGSITQRSPELQYNRKEESAQSQTQIAQVGRQDESIQCAPEVQHECNQTQSPFSKGFLRGVDVLAETEFTYTGTAESFKWKGYGFRLHFPENALPPNVSACVINVKAAISGQFEMPEDTELVSGIYCIYCPHKFIKTVTLEVQHCSEVASSDDGAQLSFVTAKCTQPNLPYRFRYCKDGVFSEHTSFASVQLTHFSMYGAVRRGRQHCRKNYCSQLYYTERSAASTKVEFIITQNLELHITAINKKFLASSAVAGPCQKVVFKKDEIKLDIPQEGVKVGEGGSIIPLTHPGIRKDQVDCFQPGTMVPSCELLIKRPLGSEIEVYRAKLIGAKEPHTFFTIECYPISVPFKIPKPTASQKPVELDVKTAISNVIKWFELGEQLEIEFSALEAILRDYAQYGTEFQRSKMVNTWLKSDPEASWSKLCGALERMGETTLAQDIKRQYIESD